MIVECPGCGGVGWVSQDSACECCGGTGFGAARVGPPADTPDEPYKAAMRANQMTADASYLARFLNELRELLGV